MTALVAARRSSMTACLSRASTASTSAQLAAPSGPPAAGGPWRKAASSALVSKSRPRAGSATLRASSAAALAASPGL
ncbi:MAG TPA: hypothetical protein PKU97_21560, partial [Kofleriaceae bacterium]|nr:hypothetical protein [Kofleriaceae bacterium]